MRMSTGTILSIIAVGALAYFLLKGSTRYRVGDNLRITGVAITYHIDDIMTVDNIKWYVFNDGSSQFRVEVSVVDASPLWHKV